MLSLILLHSTEPHCALSINFPRTGANVLRLFEIKLVDDVATCSNFHSTCEFVTNILGKNEGEFLSSEEERDDEVKKILVA